MFDHILVRHEQAAAHAAEGYARVSGRVGVCLVTSGPGATNTLTGIADAMMDSTPIVVIAGQVSGPIKYVSQKIFLGRLVVRFILQNQVDQVLLCSTYQRMHRHIHANGSLQRLQRCALISLIQS